MIAPPSPDLKDPRAMLNAGHSRAMFQYLVNQAAYTTAKRKEVA